MLVFISFCLALAYLVQSQSPVLTILASDTAFYAGLTGALLTIAGVMLSKKDHWLGYELFSCSTLFAWYAYWQPYFKAESPIFFFFPIFFAGIAVFFFLAFINQRHKIDSETIEHLRKFSEHPGLQTWIMMLCVLGSVSLLEHYRIFPVMMALLLLRFTVSSCIKDA